MFSSFNVKLTYITYIYRQILQKIKNPEKISGFLN